MARPMLILFALLPCGLAYRAPHARIPTGPLADHAAQRLHVRLPTNAMRVSGGRWSSPRSTRASLAHLERSQIIYIPCRRGFPCPTAIGRAATKQLIIRRHA